MAKIIFTENFTKRSTTFFKKHPETVNQYKKAILFLKTNPFHPSLRLHKLKGNLDNLYSVSINMKYRILLDFIIKDDQIILIDIGDHGLYDMF